MKEKNMENASAYAVSAVGDREIIFDFERDFAGKLQCMPMIARLKLDRSGVKLSLKQWNRLSLDQRRCLAALPCDTVTEIDAYGASVCEWLEAAGETPSRFRIDPDPRWEHSEGPPPQVEAFAHEVGLRSPTLQDWESLSPLQRFVLIKLTRPGHRNENLGSAMQEFGLPVRDA